MKRILYIEDNEDTAAAVKVILMDAGFEVDISLCGKEGLFKSKENYDLFLIDIMLPDISGWEIFQKLQKMKTKARFAFLSAIPVSKDKLNDLRKTGVSDYIIKPFDNQDLVMRVKKILE